MKVGFVTLFGRSNVGKSTLLNVLVGTKLAITSPKPQTTRRHVQGVLHTDEAQIIFVDTPGIFTSSRDRLTRSLNASAQNALKDVHVILHVVDPTRPIGPEDKKIFSLMEHVHIPVIVVINKMDLPRPPYVDAFTSYATYAKGVVAVSAKTGAHTRALIQNITELLPEGEPLYERGVTSNMSEEEWFAEIIREKLFLRLRNEMPYSVHVRVTALEERDNGDLYVAADVLTSQERNKRIIIGAGGRGIKEIGQSARKELEGVTNRHVYVDLQVVVDPHWTAEFR